MKNYTRKSAHNVKHLDVATYSVYKITNIYTGQSYIGKCKKDPKNRFECEHKKHTIKSEADIFHLTLQTMPEAFTLEILETDKTRLIASVYEKYYIQQFRTFSDWNTINPGYNETTGGDVGYSVSQRVRKEFSRLKKNKQEQK